MTARILAGLAALVLSFTAAGFEVHPLVSAIDVKGANSSTSIRVVNPTNVSLPIEIQAFSLLIDNERIGIGTSAEEEMLALPPAAVVPPGGTQMVRIQWLGAPDLLQDQSYVIAISELPGAVAGAPRSGVDMLLTFNAVVHVMPAGTEPALKIQGKPRLSTEGGELKAVFTLLNSGNGHALGEHITLELDIGEGRATYNADTLGRIGIELFLPPGVSRTLHLPVASQDPNTPVDARVVYDSQ